MEHIADYLDFGTLSGGSCPRACKSKEVVNAGGKTHPATEQTELIITIRCELLEVPKWYTVSAMNVFGYVCDRWR